MHNNYEFLFSAMIPRAPLTEVWTFYGIIEGTEQIQIRNENGG